MYNIALLFVNSIKKGSEIMPTVCHPKSDCITMEQMKEWREKGNRQKLEEANQGASKCPLCRRVWTRFWANQK